MNINLMLVPGMLYRTTIGLTVYKGFVGKAENIFTFLPGGRIILFIKEDWTPPDSEWLGHYKQSFLNETQIIWERRFIGGFIGGYMINDYLEKLE